MGDGDIVLNESDYGYLHGGYTSACESLPSAAPPDKTCVESPKRQLVKKTARWLKKSVTEGAVINEPQMREPDPLEEEKREVDRMERKRKEALERIKHDIINYIARYHEDPKELMAELLQGKVVVGQPGRLLVNGDMKIVLPEYDELEIEMPAMCRTLYILFMKQRKQGSDGIVLKNMDEHSDEIRSLYFMVKPGASEYHVDKTVDNLCDPLCDSLNQMISRINRCIRNVITDKQLAQQYIISGTRGEEYGIGLAPDRMELPRAVTGS